MESESCRARLCAVFGVYSGWPYTKVRVQIQRASTVVSISWFRLRRTLFLLIILNLRQITEWAADLVISSFERRFLRRMSHRLHSTVDRDVLRGLIRQEMLDAVRSAADSAQIRDCEGLS